MATIEDLQIHVGADVDDVEKEVGGLSKFVDDNFAKITAAGALAGAGMEALARKMAPANEANSQLAAMTGMSERAMRDLAVETSNVTFPLEDVQALMRTGAQQGLDSAGALQEYATFWDMVGDATGEAGPELGKAGVALQSVGIAAGNEQEALAAFGFITENTTGSVGDFLTFLERTGPELRGMGVDVNYAAALLGVMEGELGMTGRTARQEFRSAVTEADGDLGQLMATLGISEGQFDSYRAKVDEASGVIQRNADIHAESYTPLERLMHGVDELMFKYGSLIQTLGAVAPVMMALGPIAKGVAAAKGVWTAATRLLGITIMGTPIGWIIAGIAGIVAAGVLLIKNWDKVKAVAKAAFDAVWNIIKAVWEWVKKNWPTLLANLTGPIGLATLAIVKNWDKIKAGFSAALNFVKNLASSVGNWFRSTFVGAFRAVRDGISSALNSITSFFSNAWNAVQSGGRAVMDFLRSIPGAMRSGFAGVFNIITSPFKQAFNAIAGFWNNSVGRVEFKVPGWVPGIGGKGFSIPKIPMLAEGGVLRSAGSVIVGEEGMELLDLPRGARVTPLDRAEDAGGRGGRTTVIENMNVQAWSDRFDLGQINDEVRFAGAV